ncbi:hypothetical protein ASPZODRAFT_105077 [Penicilliopsis zonata CBS 506.65]|uniref:Enoyl reductase (ER) domain-containing protein n=1 Tax=Penicilliopsis zonata CBS 506.65 TaxID=1073090 RepID=A0A1L9S656_9EURO|nr:hypothetical protein ASPZODRAFT_105077 [Penicilliopsis zonata CBS 506.65]OJJ42625.1 hypothetical protein ASPZODRAFT_105077 [Penicilliopsis zonata CBS 506.65]
MQSKQWNVRGDSLEYSEKPVPALGDNEVLVKLQGASLNFRDILITQGKYPFPLQPGVIPGSDGAGTVLAIGKRVTRFSPGDHVVTIINQHFLAGHQDERTLQSGLGASLDGTFRTVGAFDEQGLVAMPACLSFVEASTLSCAGLTAWNALFGLPGRKVQAGDWLLTLGTGGVSLFAVQLAKTVGARVISTTSSEEKANILRKLGADHVINYRESPDWGLVAKQLTGGVGVDMVVEVGGATTLAQSMASLRMDGMMSVVGFVGGDDTPTAMPTLLDCWMNLFTARGVSVGNRLQMEEMCRAIEANPDKLRPVVDERVFRLEQLKEAYEYLAGGHHKGKVCIDISI